MVMSVVARKLRLQPGQRILLLNPPDGYPDAFGELPAGVVVSEQPDGEFDAAIFFVRDSGDWHALAPVAIRAVKHDGLLWVAYPKGTSRLKTDVNRDVLWSLGLELGQRPVAQVALDAVWSAVRFRPAERVGQRQGVAPGPAMGYKRRSNVGA